MFFQLGEIVVGHRVRHLRSALRDLQRGALRFGEEWARFIFPERILLFRGDADPLSRVRGVRHAVTALSGTARHLRDHVAELRIDRRAWSVDRANRLLSRGGRVDRMRRIARVRRRRG